MMSLPCRSLFNEIPAGKQTIIMISALDSRYSGAQTHARLRTLHWPDRIFSAHWQFKSSSAIGRPTIEIQSKARLATFQNPAGAKCKKLQPKSPNLIPTKVSRLEVDLRATCCPECLFCCLRSLATSTLVRICTYCFH